MSMDRSVLVWVQTASGISAYHRARHGHRCVDREHSIGKQLHVLLLQDRSGLHFEQWQQSYNPEVEHTPSL